MTYRTKLFAKQSRFSQSFFSILNFWMSEVVQLWTKFGELRLGRRSSILPQLLNLFLSPFLFEFYFFSFLGFSVCFCFCFSFCLHLTPSDAFIIIVTSPYKVPNLNLDIDTLCSKNNAAKHKSYFSMAWSGLVNFDQIGKLKTSCRFIFVNFQLKTWPKICKIGQFLCWYNLTRPLH